MKDQDRKTPVSKPNMAKSKGSANAENRGKKGQKSGPPSWWVFTKHSRAFTLAASDLSQALVANYGNRVTIAYFERMLGELPALSEEQKALIDVPSEIRVKYSTYQKHKDLRDGERESFRTFRNVQAVATGLEILEGM